jgi:hypothetical protein
LLFASPHPFAVHGLSFSSAIISTFSLQYISETKLKLMIRIYI